MTITAQTQDEGTLTKTIMGRIASVDDPEQMHELALLAIDMMLRRAEDKPLRNLLIWRAHIAISGLLNEGTASVDPARRQQAVQKFAELLRAAGEQRAPRDVVMMTNTRDEKNADDAPAARGTGLSWPIVGVIAALMAALAAALFALASNAAIMSRSAPAAVTATSLAAKIEAVPAMDGAALRSSGDGTRIYLARSRDDRPIVVAEDVPRRLCASTGYILAHDGSLTINGAAPAQMSKVAVSALCYRMGGDATLTWSPSAN